MASETYDQMVPWAQKAAHAHGQENDRGISALITRRRNEYKLAGENLATALKRCKHPPKLMKLNYGCHTDTLGNMKSGWYDLRCGICDAGVKYWET